MRIENCEMSPFVIGLADADPGRTELLGGKAANLARLIKAGFLVAEGFCVTTEAYRRHISASSRRESDREENSSVIANSPALIAVWDAVASAYAQMGNNVSVAVRSSASDEDATTNSFAGQYATLLNVVGIAAVCDAIRQCWSSLRTDTANA